MYADTSRDLAARAGLSDKQVVVDLCGGTGITAGILLEALPLRGRVISVDNAKAMQAAVQRGDGVEDRDLTQRPRHISACDSYNNTLVPSWYDD